VISRTRRRTSTGSRRRAAEDRPTTGCEHLSPLSVSVDAHLFLVPLFICFFASTYNKLLIFSLAPSRHEPWIRQLWLLYLYQLILVDTNDMMKLASLWSRLGQQLRSGSTVLLNFYWLFSPFIFIALGSCLDSLSSDGYLL
jgi:hypothetical protein